MATQTGTEAPPNQELQAEAASERTAEQRLKQRNAELAIINSVQQGLAQQLDFQAIIDLLGDKITEIFAADGATLICLYDRQTGLMHFPYFDEEGQGRITMEPKPLGEGLSSILIESRQPLLLGTSEECVEAGAILVYHSEDSDEKDTESFLGVPILAGDQVTGAVAVQSYSQYAYDENHLRLLTTLSSSMSVALENARLFDETNRLLEETQQRNAELAIINSVQQGLARQLDFQAIVDLLADKIKEIFAARRASCTSPIFTWGARAGSPWSPDRWGRV
jgi:GAF domain-containing protein